MAIASLASNYTTTSSKKGNMKKLLWENPSLGMVKLNLDASFIEATRSGGTRPVLRDAHAFFIGASNQILLWFQMLK
jgi:hypothetical protein